MSEIKAKKHCPTTCFTFDRESDATFFASATMVFNSDILDFSKIEAGKMELDIIEFNLVDVLDNLSSRVSLKADTKGLEIVFATSNDVPLSLVGDPLRLRQILINLTFNAVKFTDTGEIVVRTEVAPPSSSHEPDEIVLRFSVQDTGIGITPEQVGRLFS